MIVTGSTRGIGEATAALFAADGAHVVVHGWDAHGDPDVLERIRCAGGSTSFLAADLRDPSSADALIAHAVDHTGRVDVLVNNAGANVFTGTIDADLETWNNCLDLDLRAAWLCAKAAAAVMERPGAIVNVASNHAFSTMAGVFPYNVAKAGVLAMTQSLALELADRGIRVNAVCNDAYFGTFTDPAAERARVERLHPLKRLGRPEEVARAIRFLASEEDSGFTTGTTVVMDGGRSALLQDPVS